MIIKEANPADGTSFLFTKTIDAETEDFVLRDPSDNSQSFKLTFDTEARITELVTFGWNLTFPDPVCESTFDGGFQVALDDSTLIVSSTAPENDRTCTFFDERIPPIPTLNQWGMHIMAGVLGLFAFISLFVMRGGNEGKPSS